MIQGLQSVLPQHACSSLLKWESIAQPITTENPAKIPGKAILFMEGKAGYKPCRKSNHWDFKGNSQNSPHNGMGSTVNWSPFSSQGALFNQASVFTIKLGIPTPLWPRPQLLPCLSYKKDRKSKESHTDWISLYELLVPPSGSRHFNRKKGFLTWFMCKSQHLDLKSWRNLHNHLWVWAWLGFKVPCLGAKGHVLCI